MPFMNLDKVLKIAKGYYGKAKNCRKIANMRVEKALQHQYRDRKLKKREMRALWIQKVNAGVRQYGVRYSEFIPQLQNAEVIVDRKILADLAQNEPFSFKAVLDVANLHGKRKIVADSPV